MDAPVYSVTVASVSNGWSYTATHGQPAPEGTPTVLADPLSVSGGFEDHMIPNQLEPHVVNLNLWSTSSIVRPAVRRGDQLTLRIRLGGPAGPTLLYLPVQVSAVETDLDPAQDYPYRATITATDQLVALRSYSPAPRAQGLNAGVNGLGNRLAWLGFAGGYSIGAPAGFVASVNTPTGVWWLRDKPAAEAWRLMLATAVPPPGRHHALTPYVGAGYPAGYGHTGASFGPGASGVAVPDPGSSIKGMVQPASRTLDYDPGLPLRFVKANGRLELTGAPSSTADRMPTVPARACSIPTSARQGREHAPNSVRLLARMTNVNGVPADPANLEADTIHVVAYPEVNTVGWRQREVEVLATIRDYADDPATAGPVTAAGDALAVSYLAEPAALTRDWTFDAIQVSANDLTAAEAAEVLPVLIPAYLDGERDGRLVRHLTVHSIDPDVRLDSTSSYLDGYVVAWRVEIAGGQLHYVITTTPGQPATAAAPVTVGQFTGAGYVAGVSATQVHPNITIADLDRIGA